MFVCSFEEDYHKKHICIFLSCLFFTVRDDISIIPIWLLLYLTRLILFLTMPQPISNDSFCVSISSYSNLRPVGINLCWLSLHVTGVGIKLYRPTAYSSTVGCYCVDTTPIVNQKFDPSSVRNLCWLIVYRYFGTFIDYV